MVNRSSLREGRAALSRRRRLMVAMTAVPSVLLSGAAFAQGGASQLDAPWIAFETGAYPGGYEPRSSVMADFNGDSVPDLAVTGTELSILLGDGEGGFISPQAIPLALVSFDLVSGDFDSDGDIDLVVCDTGSFREGRTVSWYANDGEAGFTLLGSFDAGNDAPADIAAADFDGDGLLDVAVAHDRYIEYASSAAVLLNDGENGFESPITIQLDVGTQAIAAGDIDGDGDPDLVVAHLTNKCTVIENEGAAFLPGPVINGIASGAPPCLSPAVVLAEVDNDGDLDLLFSNIDSGGQNQPGAVGLWRNDGAGAFGPAQTLNFGLYTNGGVDISVTDLNDDGWPDVVAATDWSGYWFTRLGDGAGEFLPARGVRSGQSPVRVHGGDLDGDGDLDVTALARDSMAACVHTNPGDGVFPQPDLIDMSSPSLDRDPTNFNAGDFDQDGDLDLVSGSSEPGAHYQLVVRRNNGNGTFGPRETYIEAASPRVIQLGDINGDEALDVVWIDHESRLRARLNLGDGTLGARMSMHVLQPDRHYFELHDADNDGDLDVITPGFFDVLVLRNEGNGVFGPPLETYLDTWFGMLTMGDFDEDGILDLLINGGEQGYPRLCIGVGDGTFEQPVTIPTGRSVTAFDVADLNGDGHLDFVVWFELDGGGLSVRLGDGNGSFQPNASYPGSFDVADPTSSIDLADVDGDGGLDAVFASRGAEELAFWSGNPDGTFGPVQRLGVGQAGWDVEVDDFTGDGLTDAAVLAKADVNGVRGYPAVVLLRGEIAGGVGPQLAPLVDYLVQFGQWISGDLESLRNSDDLRLRVRSRLGFTAQEPNLIDLRVGAATDALGAETLELSIEGRLNTPGGTARVRLRNWTTGLLEPVHQYSIGTTEMVERMTDLGTANRIRASDGRVEASLRCSVVVTFTAQGFDAFVDHVAVLVE